MMQNQQMHPSLHKAYVLYIWRSLQLIKLLQNFALITLCFKLLITE